MSHPRSTFTRAALVAALLTSTAPAWSAGAADEAAAATLFQEAKQLRAAGDFAAACPKFVEAQHLYPTAGTLLSVADCYEHVGKLASAWGAFKAAAITARTSGDSAREAEAERRADLIAPHLPRLAIVVPPEARIPGFEVKRDGVPVGEGQWGSSLPADAGEHTVEAAAPGRKPWSAVVQVEPSGPAGYVEVPVLETLPAEVLAASAPSFSWSAQQVAGAGVGGLGLVGLAIGGVLGGVAKSKYDATTPAMCLATPANVCNAAGIAARATVAKLGNASTGLLVAGGAAVVAGVVVVVTAPAEVSATAGGLRRIEVAPVAGLGTAGLQLRGEW